MKTALCHILGIEYPIVAAPMGPDLTGPETVAAVSNAGGLGVLQAQFCAPPLFRAEIRRVRAMTDKPFGVNIPLIRGDVKELVRTVIEENIKIVFTSAGNPAIFSKELKSNGIKLVHVVASVKHALKAQDSATARRVAHSVKGTAANLGANALATAAGSAEVAIKTQSDVEPALREVERTLFAAVAAIQKTPPSAEKVESTLSGNGDPSVVLQPLSRLKKLLEADDSEAAEFIVEAQNSFSAVLSRTEIETLTRMVGDFDYESALRAVSGIADRLSLKLE